MLISKNWLQDYFKEKLPNTKEIAEVLTMKAFEIENIEAIKSDEILDIKVLPNRAHDCLSHRGVAKEIAALFQIKAEIPEAKDYGKNESSIEVVIETNLCNRCMYKIISNIRTEDSPGWIKERLQNLGQRAISNVVDATNYAMLDTGQPMHAFDLDKLVRKHGKYRIGLKAVERETPITTLGGREYILPVGTLVFIDLNRDGYNILDIAGTKGGILAEIDNNTKNIALTAANFDQTYIRKYSKMIGIQTDATKRSENGIAPELAEIGMSVTEKIIKETAATEDTVSEKNYDWFPEKKEPTMIRIGINEIIKLLGARVTFLDIENIFNRNNWLWKKEEEEFVVTVPKERLDLNLKEDLVEEIGRFYGYEKIEPIIVRSSSKKIKSDSKFEMVNKLKFSMTSLGYSEVYNYAFSDEGEIEIANPTASNRPFLRDNLKKGLEKSLEINYKNAPLLGLDEIKIFEIGTVFNKDGEKINVAWGTKNKTGETKVEECELKEAFEKFLKENIDQDFSLPKSGAEKFKPISPYPFISRDIAVWTPVGTKEDSVLKLILENAGEFLVQKRLFDRFEKNNKVSYAFNLVFQSQNRTLTDKEINAVMEQITAILNSKEGWQVR